MCLSANHDEGEPSHGKKPTRLLTNVWPLVKLLAKRCPGHAVHQPLIGGRAGPTAVYTDAFVKAILKGLRHHLQHLGVYAQVNPPHELPSQAIAALSTWHQQKADNEANRLASVLATFVQNKAEFQDELEVYLLHCFPSHRILGGADSSSPTVAASRPRARPALDDDVETDPVMQSASRQLVPIGEGDHIQKAADKIDTWQRAETGQWSLAPDLRREPYRRHRNLGHPDRQAFVRALRHANAKEEVINWAKRYFNCPLCEARQKPTLPRPGHLVRQMEFNQVVGIDTFFYPFQEETLNFLNILCWGSGLQILGRLSDIMGLMIHVIDARAPWQNGRTEKAGGLFKEKLSLALQEIQATSKSELINAWLQPEVAGIPGF